MDIAYRESIKELVAKVSTLMAYTFEVHFPIFSGVTLNYEPVQEGNSRGSYATTIRIGDSLCIENRPFSSDFEHSADRNLIIDSGKKVLEGLYLHETIDGINPVAIISYHPSDIPELENSWEKRFENYYDRVVSAMEAKRKVRTSEDTHISV